MAVDLVKRKQVRLVIEIFKENECHVDEKILLTRELRDVIRFD
jgi:hypothetical protein